MVYIKLRKHEPKTMWIRVEETFNDHCEAPISAAAATFIDEQIVELETIIFKCVIVHVGYYKLKTPQATAISNKIYAL